MIADLDWDIDPLPVPWQTHSTEWYRQRSARTLEARMATVRFASICDKCGTRSREYSSWATCEDCGEDACPQCDVSEARNEDERNNSTLCKDCAKQRLEDEIAAADPDNGRWAK